MRISIYFFILFFAQGILQPYMPPYYKSLGFNGKQLAIVAALSQLATIFSPPFWGFQADRAGNPVRYLRLLSILALITFVPMFWAQSFLAVAIVFGIYALFITSLSPLADTVAMTEARRMGTEYGRLRLWGSIGFIVAVYSFGEVPPAQQLEYILICAVVVIVAYTAAAFFLEPAPPAGFTPPSLADAGRLLAQPAFFWFLMSAMIHWIALQSFYLLYSIHMKSLAFDSYVGKGIAMGVCAEVFVMWKFRSLIKRLPLFSILAVSLVCSALRWFLVSKLQNGWALSATQTFHGLSFGAFYVCSIAQLERAVPERLRATGRALFSSFVLGLGGILGSMIAGTLYDYAGQQAPLAFLASSGLELFALLPLGLAAWFYRAQASKVEALKTETIA